MSSYGHKYKGAGTGIWWVQWEWPYMLIYFNINFPVSRTYLETLRTTDIVGISVSRGEFCGYKSSCNSQPSPLSVSNNYLLPQTVPPTGEPVIKLCIFDGCFSFIPPQVFSCMNMLRVQIFFPTRVMWLKIICSLEFHFLIIMKAFQCSHIQCINSSEIILDTPLLLSTINLFPMLFKLL